MLRDVLLSKTKQYKFSKNNISSLKNENGVYVYLSNKKLPIYIGKSVNIKQRVSSYLLKNLYFKTKKMVSDIECFFVIYVTSEIEALLLEAKLIKRYKPYYNTQLKDDKNPLYIIITNDKYPRVITGRKKDTNYTHSQYYGPFPNSRNVKTVLRMLRKIFPYSQHLPDKKVCIYNQMGLCNPCPTQMEKAKSTSSQLNKEYKKYINSIKSILNGSLKHVRKNMYKEMKSLSRKQHYEEAQLVRNKIDKLDYILQPVTKIDNFLLNPNLIEDIRSQEIASLFNLLNKHIPIIKIPIRIECYDVSHLAGNYPTASMITFVNGEPNKNFYRNFKIQQKYSSDDVSSMTEVAKRRESHLKNWGVADLIVVDGGKSQLLPFVKIFSKYNISVVGLAKKHETLVMYDKNKYIEVRVPKGPQLNLLQRLRDEAHRFARRYHHKLLQKGLIPLQ